MSAFAPSVPVLNARRGKIGSVCRVRDAETKALSGSRARVSRRRTVVAVASSSTKTSPVPAETGREAEAPESDIPQDNAFSAFLTFFDMQPGSWNSARTYHYVHENTREESSTTFDVSRLTASEILNVLDANGDASMYHETVRQKAQGFSVSFMTKMQSQEELVRSSTDLAFVPLRIEGSKVHGKYYRLIGYEESAPTKANFTFDADTNQLVMTTTYTRVVSVDEMTLVNPTVRIRKIINYVRPSDGEPLTDPQLVGCGLERKLGAHDKKLVS